MTDVQGYDSLDDMFEAIGKIREQAAVAVDPAHLARIMGENQEGGWWVNLSTAMQYEDLDLVIFCRIIGKEEFMYEVGSQERWEDQLKTGFLLGECFSPTCPDGEWGDTHVTRLEFPISNAVVKVIRQDGWKILDNRGGLTDGGVLIRAAAERHDAEKG